MEPGLLILPSKNITNPCCEIPLNNMTEEELNQSFNSFFGFNPGSPQPKITPQPAKYEDEKKSIKIAERHPLFGFASLLDEILEDFGGVQEIFQCNWDCTTNQGTVICLMNDWRVFRYVLKANEFATLKPEDRISKINRECQIFEDVEDWGHWIDLGGENEEPDKRTIQQKKIDEKMTVYGEKMRDALDDFFSGNVDSLQKMMQKNDGKNKKSYLEAEE